MYGNGYLTVIFFESEKNSDSIYIHHIFIQKMQTSLDHAAVIHKIHHIHIDNKVTFLLPK
jgi:hypothetical protein